MRVMAWWWWWWWGLWVGGFDVVAGRGWGGMASAVSLSPCPVSCAAASLARSGWRRYSTQPLSRGLLWQAGVQRPAAARMAASCWRDGSQEYAAVLAVQVRSGGL